MKSYLRLDSNVVNQFIGRKKALMLAVVTNIVTDEIHKLFMGASLYVRLALQSSLYDAHLKKYTELKDRVAEYQRLKNKISFF